MLSALRIVVWSGLVVGSVECPIDCLAVCALDDGMVCALDAAVCVFFFLLLDVDFGDMHGTVEVKAVAGDMI